MKLARLVELAEAGFAADGITGDIAVVGGALDGIERVLQTQLRPGDRVAIEDPTWPRITDLVQALGLQPEPVRVDQRGPVPGELARALERGAQAVIATPRGQNPTGAAVAAERGGQLCELLGRHPDAVIIEDDYVAAVAGAPRSVQRRQAHGCRDRHVGGGADLARPAPAECRDAYGHDFGAGPLRSGRPLARARLSRHGRTGLCELALLKAATDAGAVPAARY